MNEEKIIKILEEFNKIKINSYAMQFVNIPYPKLQEAIQGLLDLYNKEKEKNKNLLDNLNHCIRSSAIKERLGIEEDISEEQMLDYIDILVSENARLEDIEDKKVQIEYQNVFNKGVKSVEDKIKEKIEELEKQEDWYIENKSLDDLYGKIDILQELLEERN